MKQLFPFLLSCFFTLSLVAQPNIQWQVAIGGSLGDEGNSVLQTSDGGYIIAGTSSSNDGDVPGQNPMVEVVPIMR